MILDGAFDGPSVEIYIRELRRKNKGVKLAVFLDNLSAHKTVEVSDAFKELDITPVFNATYAPEFNPIELIFAQVKLRYKADRLNKLANDIEYDERKMIMNAFNSVSKLTILNCIRHCLTLLKI